MEENNSSNLEKQRLEVEKLKLELELKKLELEKSRSDSFESANNNLDKPKETNTVNILALILAILSIFSLAVPWVKGVASGSVNTFGFNSSSSLSSGSLSGFNSTEGQLCVILTLLGAWLNYKGNRISGVLGIICILLIIVFIYRMAEMHSNISTYGASGSFKMEIQDEILISLLSYLIYSIVSFWNFLKSKTARINILLFAAGALAYAVSYLLVDEREFLVYLFGFTACIFLFSKFQLPLAKFMLFVTAFFVLTNYAFDLAQTHFNTSESKYINKLFDDNGIIELFAMGAVHMFGLMFLFEFVLKCFNKPKVSNVLAGSRYLKLSIVALSLLYIGLPIYNYASTISKFHDVTESERKSVISLLDDYTEEAWCLSNAEMNRSYYPLSFQTPNIEYISDFGEISVKYNISFGINKDNYEVSDNFMYNDIVRSNEYTFYERSDNHLIKMKLASKDTIFVEYISRTWRGNWDYDGAIKLIGLKESTFLKKNNNGDSSFKELVEMYLELSGSERTSENIAKYQYEYLPKVKKYLSSVNLLQSSTGHWFYKLAVSPDSLLIVGSNMGGTEEFVPYNSLTHKGDSIAFSFLVSPHRAFQIATYESVYKLNDNMYLLYGVIDGDGSMYDYALQFIDISKEEFGINQKVFGDSASHYTFPSSFPEDDNFKAIIQIEPNRFKVISYIRTSNDNDQLNISEGEIIWDGKTFYVNYEKLPIEKKQLPSL